MEKENLYYNGDDILKYAEQNNCPFVAVVGGKGNGKTYYFIRKALQARIKKNLISRYLRRYAESIKPKAIQSLCNPHIQTLINLTEGKYNGFHYYQNRFFLVRRENNKIVEKDSQPFLVCSALNSVEANTGADEGQCAYIIFDEFMSREKEIEDCYYKLMIYHNNCIRNRTDVFSPLVLIGNTVTRNSIIASEFGVNLYELKQGEITAVKNKKDEICIVVEYCGIVEVMEQAENTYYKRFDNDRIKMVYRGEWTVGNYPHITRDMLNITYTILTIKIITPNKQALLFDIRKMYGASVFGYVRKCYDDDERYICTLINKTHISKKHTYNYLPQRGIFKEFIKLVYTKNVYFESNEIGEMFRDFLNSFTGCQNLRNIYT